MRCGDSRVAEAGELAEAAARLIVRLREAERLAREGRVEEAKAALRDTVKEARERGLERPLHYLILRVRALIRRKIQQRQRASRGTQPSRAA
jgi:hypothetical protein